MGGRSNDALSVGAVGRARRLFGRNHLKLILASGDVIAVLLAYFLSGWGTGFIARQGIFRLIVVTALGVVAALWALRSQGLYLARVSAVRVVEITRTARAVVILGGVILLSDRI